MKILSMGLTILFCSLEGYAGSILYVDVDATVNHLRENKDSSLAKDQPLELDESPVLITSPGKVPVLLYPMDGDEKALRVSLPDAGKPGTLSGSKFVESELSSVLVEFTGVQDLIKSRRLKEAEERLNRLQARYPDLKFLEFLRASIHALAGEKAKASETLQRGLASHPDYAPGLEMKKQLGGGQ